MGVVQIESGTEARCDECLWVVQAASDWSECRDPWVRASRQKRQLREAHRALEGHQAREHAEQLRELASDQLGELDTGWEPYDDRPELQEARRYVAETDNEPVWLHPMNGSGAWPAATPRVQRWYDLDAPTAAALMVLAPVVAAVGGVVVFVARRFRVVRR